MLLTAMRWPSCGVMIARGDLAVECGFERLAEVQEEILWIAEAAHVPVIWATQVLETLAKKGMASRAEITDAAMGQRAECVMLNKGPHVLSAVRVLGDILQRMQAHKTKRRSLLRELRLAKARPTDLRNVWSIATPRNSVVEQPPNRPRSARIFFTNNRCFLPVHLPIPPSNSHRTLLCTTRWFVTESYHGS